MSARRYLLPATFPAPEDPSPKFGVLLSTSLTSDAIAASGLHGGPKGNNGYGNSGGDGSPNGKPDRYR
jgi:hypothetical protein